MTPRGTDWGLAGLLAALIATGALTLFAGGTGDTWVFAAHDVLGAAIAVLLVVKLRRVWPRLVNLARPGYEAVKPQRRDRRAIVGLLAALLAAAALGSGWLWAGGAAPSIGGFSLLSWHDVLGVVLALVVAGHMTVRAKRARRRDLANRRQFLVAAGAAAGALVAWRVQRPVQALVGLRGAHRRFTGSYEVASFQGNAFPTTSWIADRPRAIAADEFRLSVGGLVGNRLLLTARDLLPLDELVATLDCTGGFYSTQRWRGIRLGRLIDRAGPAPNAHHVHVASRTGYRWSFALSDARELLLATHVGGEPINHEHGAPARLVVPGARGFQWIKWVSRIDLLEMPDYAAPASTVWSSFTRAGRGQA